MSTEADLRFAEAIEQTALGMTLQIRDAFIVHDAAKAAEIADSAESLLVKTYGDRPELLARMFVHLCVEAAGAGFTEWSTP